MLTAHCLFEIRSYRGGGMDRKEIFYLCEFEERV